MFKCQMGEPNGDLGQPGLFIDSGIAVRQGTKAKFVSEKKSVFLVIEIPVSCCIAQLKE